MKLAVISMIRDEGDIISPFLKHLSALFDIVFLFDHRSSDGSSDVMQKACAQHKEWHYYYCDFAGYHQKIISTIFMKKAFALGADAVFFMDSDEFVDTESKLELQNAAALINDKKAIGFFEWRPCIPETFNEWNFDISTPMWVADKNSNMSKIAISRSSFMSTPSMGITQGNHNVTPRRIAEAVQRLHLGHYFHIPIRSHAQVVKKVLVQGFAERARNSSMIKDNWHTRQIVELISEKRLSDDVLTSLAGKYSEMRDFECWVKQNELAQNGFTRRTLNVPTADLSLPQPAQPELTEILARCVRDFALEKMHQGSLQVTPGLVRFELSFAGRLARRVFPLLAQLKYRVF